MRALLMIDLSNDFIRLDGALSCGESGLAIIPYCKNLVHSFVVSGDLVVDTRDSHSQDDWEIDSGLFPPHNLEGTDGQQLIPELADLRPMDGNGQWVYVPKKHYNATYATLLTELLERHKITEVHLVGVCTDICVRYTLAGLYDWRAARRYAVDFFVHRHGVASFNAVGHEESLQHFPATFGAKVI
ncbi:MAG: cysteine hydrolase [Alicyclobacillaceae bacterium]|uniref:cysteine hydrolase family protein n=1 Tax=Alicyclobacillus sp. SP_1 TaxID=2942475 RepID=UPI002157D27D|nr:isochorismatase family cysteine hydrolase [Alicyclobacillus sp. SP_1]MCY0895272.1 cysteine hydrolase [Alicyclobacillaceae bacterium]